MSPRTRAIAALVALALALALPAGCGAHAAPEEALVRPPPAPPSAPLASALPVPAAPAGSDRACEGERCGGPGAEAPPAASAEPAVPFPPPAFPPPHPATAAPGDGVWTAIEPGASGRPPSLYRTTVHPHPKRPQVVATIIAADLLALALRLVGGTEEPRSDEVPKEHRTGLIPAGDQGALVAVFNGGFKARHGGFGMMVDGERYLPPLAQACTVALYRDETVRIAPFAELASTEGSMRAFRQTPPCLISGGALHEDLVTERWVHGWGASVEARVDVRRSAVGVDAARRTLFFAAGDWVTPKNLADAVRSAGASSAAQLDINWSYTRFFLTGRPSTDAPPRLVASLVPKLKYAPDEYVTKPSARDFFYLARR